MIPEPRTLVLRDKNGQILRVNDRVEWAGRFGIIDECRIDAGTVVVWMKDGESPELFSVDLQVEIKGVQVVKMSQ